jgi:hypothetical protein
VLVEKLKWCEVAKAQGLVAKPDDLALLALLLYSLFFLFFLFSLYPCEKSIKIHSRVLLFPVKKNQMISTARKDFI